MMTVKFLEIDNILVLIGLLGMFIYNGFVMIRYKKVPGSLSETAYIIGGESLKRYWFTFYCLFTTAMILPPLFMCTRDGLEVLPFLLCVGLLFAGYSPTYKSGIERPVHYISAYLSFGSFILYSILCIPWYWLVGYVILLGLFCLWKPKCYVYFAEILALIDISLWILLE